MVNIRSFDDIIILNETNALTPLRKKKLNKGQIDELRKAFDLLESVQCKNSISICIDGIELKKYTYDDSINLNYCESGRYILSDRNLQLDCSDFTKDKLEQVDALSTLDYGILYSDVVRAYSLKDLKALLITRLKDQSAKNLKGLAVLFGEDAEKLRELVDNMDVKADRLYKILKVWEINNIRFALTCTKSEASTECRLLVTTPKQDYYDYIDEGRYYYTYTHYTYVPKLFLWDDLDPSEVDEYYLRNFNGRLLNKATYNQLVKEHKLEYEREKREKELKEKISEEIKKKIDSISKSNPLRVNGMTITDKEIDYNGQKIRPIKCDYNSIKDLLKYRSDLSNLDFNDLVDDFVRILSLSRDWIIELGTVRITHEITENKAGADRHLLNGIRINAGEVLEVVRQATCFTDTKSYNEFLSRVSKCSLRISRLLADGWQPRLYVGEDQQILKFNLKRIKNHNYIILDGKEYRINNIQKLSDNFGSRWNGDDMLRLADILRSIIPESEKDVNKIIIKSINDAKKFYEESVKRSEKFLKSIIEQHNISTVKKKIGDKEIEGYLVTGNSGKKYLVTKKAKVYDYNTSRYICIVDKDGSTGGFLNDKIASRILALLNDMTIAQDVHTLRG